MDQNDGALRRRHHSDENVLILPGAQVVGNVTFTGPECSVWHNAVIRGGPEGITIETPSANKIVISGADKEVVGQFAAEVREKRPPEPYKGKGIKYTDEVIRRKEGKTGVKKK